MTTANRLPLVGEYVRHDLIPGVVFRVIEVNEQTQRMHIIGVRGGEPWEGKHYHKELWLPHWSVLDPDYNPDDPHERR